MMILTNFFKGFAPPPAKMVTLTYSCLDDNNSANNSWVEASRQPDRTYSIHLISETSGQKSRNLIAKSQNYTETKAILKNFEQGAAEVYKNSDYEKKTGRQTFPEKMTTLAFNEGHYSAELFNFIQTRYNKKASGDIWMEAVREKDNTYHINLYDKFVHPKKHDLHMVVDRNRAIEVMREFEQRAATITKAGKLKTRRLFEADHFSKYVDLDAKRKHKPKHFSRFK
jgi:hypothetical protein